MGRNLVNLTKPEPKQLWRHVTSGVELLIISVDEHNEWALCALMFEGGGASKLRVDVPVEKFKNYGNRGFRLVGTRKHTLPAAGTHAGQYNPRLLNLGAD